MLLMEYDIINIYSYDFINCIKLKIEYINVSLVRPLSFLSVLFIHGSDCYLFPITGESLGAFPATLLLRWCWEKDN